jgi:hypothetical protein
MVEWRVQLHSFLTSAYYGGWWSASHPGRFSPGKRAGWAGLDAEAKRKNLVPTGIRTPVVQPVVSHCTDWAPLAPVWIGTGANEARKFNHLNSIDLQLLLAASHTRHLKWTRRRKFFPQFPFLRELHLLSSYILLEYSSFPLKTVTMSYNVVSNQLKQ